MRNFIIVGFLSMWIFSILTPSVIAIVNKGQDAIVVIWHNEEEQQESGKKDSLEEKIIPNVKHQITVSHLMEEFVPSDINDQHSSNHIVEIHLPPPERNLDLV